MADKQDGTSGRLRVVALEADNFKRLKAVRVIPRGDVVEIVGRNGAGKTSVLDAIMATICGASSVPERPVRDGAASGETFVDLGELRVTRTYNAASGTTALKVERKDGTRITSPQKALDALFNPDAFDPLEFANAKAADQAETLRKLVGLDLADLDAEAVKLHDERADLNKSIKVQAFEFNAYGPAEEWAEIPDAPVSIAGLANDLKLAGQEQAKVNARRHEFRTMLTEQTRAIVSAEKAKGDAERARKRLAELEAAEGAAQAEVAKLAERIEADRLEVEALTDPNVGAITDAMADAEAVNARVRRKAERKALGETLSGNKGTLAAVGNALAELKAERMRRIGACHFPLPGIGLSEDGTGVTLNGVPVSQASTAQAVVMGLAVAVAKNPRLRFTRIKDGSLLDDDTMALVAAWARDNDVQVFVERVGGPNSPTGIIIEDGEVLADRQPGPAVKASPRFGASALAALEAQDLERGAESKFNDDPLQGPMFTGM